MILLSQMNLSEYDQRQIALMKEMVASFESDQLSLKRLIDNLEGLLFCLQSVDEKWKEAFHEHWFTLEQIYAVALFRNELISHDDPDLNGALRHLSELLTK